MIINKAIETIHASITEKGLTATSIDSDNYKRIWSRDATMTGIAGCLHGDIKTIAAFADSIDTLRDHQHSIGIIPSNVGDDVSYGSIVGRVDATLWYIIAVQIYVRTTQDQEFLQNHIQSIVKAFSVIEAWEFNSRHLVYTPMSGNWADEYPIQGYTLYDNCLRLWGLRLWNDLFETSDKAEAVEQTIKNNFWLDSNTEKKYNKNLYNRTALTGKSEYFEAGFDPSRYYRMFDAAGNGLAMMLGLANTDQIDAICQYIEKLFDTLQADYIPAFWPPIREGDSLWNSIQENYSYDFKNHPHHFHNGGIWPIMMGWLSVGLKVSKRENIAFRIQAQYSAFAKSENYNFSEYIASNSLQSGGKSNMCFSASGAILMNATQEEISRIL